MDVSRDCHAGCLTCFIELEQATNLSVVDNAAIGVTVY
jgi:hypothetical protein